MHTPIEIESVNDQLECKTLWSIRFVAERTGLSKATIYRYTVRGLFPPRRHVGPGRVAWLASEVIEWIDSRPLIDRHQWPPGPTCPRCKSPAT